MRLGDLVDELKRLDPEMEVIVSTEYPVVVDGRQRYALDPESVDVVDVVPHRDEAGLLQFTYEKSDLSRRIAIISATPDM
jgi:hypothetical protein